MGKIKSKQVKRSVHALLEADIELSKDFEMNKKILGQEMPSKKMRNKIFNDCIRKMQSYVNIAMSYTELKKLAGTIENGLEQWFTCVLHPEIEPTNNRAERELREFVVQRKIFGSLRSEKGMVITETIMSVLATWRIRELNTYSMLRTTLSS